MKINGVINNEANGWNEKASASNRPAAGWNGENDISGGGGENMATKAMKLHGEINIISVMENAASLAMKAKKWSEVSMKEAEENLIGKSNGWKSSKMAWNNWK